MYKRAGFYNPCISGDLDIFSAAKEDLSDCQIERRREVYIHGTPEGLRSLAALLLELADADQTLDPDIRYGAAEHVTIFPDRQLAASSDTVTIGRLDRKGSGDFYERFIGRKQPDKG